MGLPLYLRGLLIGFLIAAPVGPIGVLCIRRTLVEGRVSGLVSGLSAATADAVYGAIAGFGLTQASSFLLAQGSWVRIAGGLFLILPGIRTFSSKPAEQPAAVSGNGLVGVFLSTLFSLSLIR